MRSLLHSTSCASQFFHAFTLDVTELVGPSSLTHITPRCSTLRHPHYFLTVLPYATHTTPHTTPHCTHLRHPPYSPLSSPTPPNYSRLLRHLCYALFSPTFITTPLFAVRLLTLYSSPSRTTPQTTPHTTPPHAVLLRTLYFSPHSTPPHTLLVPTKVVSTPPSFVLGETNATKEFLAKFPLGKVPAFESKEGQAFNCANAIAIFLGNDQLR